MKDSQPYRRAGVAIKSSSGTWGPFTVWYRAVPQRGLEAVGKGLGVIGLGISGYSLYKDYLNYHQSLANGEPEFMQRSYEVYAFTTFAAVVTALRYPGVGPFVVITGVCYATLVTISLVHQISANTDEELRIGYDSEQNGECMFLLKQHKETAETCRGPRVSKTNFV